MRGTRIVWAFLILAVGFGMCATPSQAEDLSTLIPELLDDHERLKAARDKEKASAYRLREAEAGWYPRLDLTGDLSRESVDRTGNPQTQLNRNTGKLRATQLVYDFGGTTSNIKRYTKTLEQDELQRISTRQGLILEGVLAYLDLIKYQKTLGYSLQTEENIKTQTGIEETLVSKGAGLSSDVLQAKSQLAAAAALRVVAEGDLINAQNRYRAVFRKTVPQDAIENFQMPDVPYDKVPVTLEDAVDIAISSNPQILIASKSVDVAQSEYESVYARLFPRLDLYGELEHKENKDGVKETRHEMRGGLEVQYNLYAGGGDSAAMQAAQYSKSESRNSLFDLQRTVEEQVRISWQNLLTARAQAEWFRNQAVIEGEFLELARKERKLGNRSLLDVLTAEGNYIRALSGAVAAEIQQKQEAYNLMFAMGLLEVDMFQ